MSARPQKTGQSNLPSSESQTNSSPQPPASARNVTPRRLISDEIVEERIRAQKRAAIGLDPVRPTAARAAYRPGESQPPPLLRWSAVILAVGLLLAAILLVFALRPDLVERAGDTPLSQFFAGSQTPTPVSLAPGDVLLLLHDFDEPVRTMAQHNEPGSWVMGFVDGIYRIRTVQPGQMAYTTLGLFNPAPFRVETELVISPETPESYAGLFLRIQDAENYYTFTVDGAGQYAVSLTQDGRPSPLIGWTESTAVRPPGETNHLAVIDTGRTVQFVVNGTQVATVDDMALPTGDLALVSGSVAAEGSQTDFDWVAVVQIPAP